MSSAYFPNVLIPEQHEDLPELPKSVDTSEALFSMYLERSDHDDREVTQRWKGESDAILIFTGLFSAALAALLALSIQDLRPNSQDTSAFYLANIYILFANVTSSQPVILPRLSNPPQFSPPTYAVLVNSLWLLSLVMSLTGALLAVFVQQWAQSYLQATQVRYSPRKRARVRSFYAEGIDKSRLFQVTRAVPTLIHISLLLFFSGLQVFLFHVNLTVFKVISAWLAICILGYTYITLMPIFCPDSPYYSPLSSSVWLCVTSTLYVIYRLLKSFVPRGSPTFNRDNSHYSRPCFDLRPSKAMQEEAENAALRLSSDIDYRALLWMFGTLNDDDEFEQFFDALPGLCTSEELKDSHEGFIKANGKVLSHALIGLMNRTLSSNLVSEHVKQRRIIICAKAINATSFIGPGWILPRVLGDWHRFLGCVEFGLFVQNWSITATDRLTAFYAQCAIAVVISTVLPEERKEPWCQLARGHLQLSNNLLHDYLAKGDSILLANAIFIVRQTIQTYSGSVEHHRGLVLSGSSKTLELICKFNIESTLPGLRHEFCSLWNQLIDVALSDDSDHPHARRISVAILKSIRRVFIVLHKNTDASPTTFSSSTDDMDPVLDDALSYPKCTLTEHRPSLPVPEIQLDEHPSHTTENAPNALIGATESILSSAHIDPVLSSSVPRPTPPHPSTSATLTLHSIPTHASTPHFDPHGHLATVSPTLASVPPPTDAVPSSFTHASSRSPSDHLILQLHPITPSTLPSISNTPITANSAPSTEGGSSVDPQSPPSLADNGVHA